MFYYVYDYVFKHLFVTVIDVYAAWCGPCKSIINTFKRIKIDCSDELLSFAIVRIKKMFLKLIFHLYIHY